MPALSEGTGPIWITEGEKDADRLAAEGVTATCSADPGSPPQDLSPLAGRAIHVVMDRDQAGSKNARAWADALDGTAESVRFFAPAVEHVKADVSDHLDAGHTLDELIEVRFDGPRVVPVDSRAEGDAPSVSPSVACVSETGNTGKTGETGARLWRGTDLAESEPTRWLMRGHLPLAKVAVLIGDEGIGKSLWWVLVVAHITTGRGNTLLGIPPLPPRQVILVLTEDSWTDDVRPRLEAAGADLSRVHVLAEDSEGNGSPFFPRDYPVILDSADDVEPALIVVDAWLDTVQSGLQVKDPQQARQALHPWRNVAQTTGACVLLLAHSNRADDGNLRNRVGATAALRQKARVLLYAAQPPDGEGVLYLGPDKANGAAKADAVAYKVAVKQIRPATEDDLGTIARLEPTGATGATMETHYATWRAQQRRSEHPDAEERAWQWLKGYIDEHGEDTARGRQVSASEAKAAAEQLGINAKLLAPAVKAHGGYVGPDGVGGPWVHRLALDGSSVPSVSSVSSVSSLTDTGNTGGKTANGNPVQGTEDNSLGESSSLSSLSPLEGRGDSENRGDSEEVAGTELSPQAYEQIGTTATDTASGSLLDMIHTCERCGTDYVTRCDCRHSTSE